MILPKAPPKVLTTKTSWEKKGNIRMHMCVEILFKSVKTIQIIKV